MVIYYELQRVILDYFFDGIRLDNSDGKYEMFSVESHDRATLGLINSKVLGVAYN